jgi:hypothetical protein
MSIIIGDDEDDDVARQANPVIVEATVGCVRRDDGKKTHVFLDGGNKCQCGDVDLHAYREVVLR